MPITRRSLFASPLLLSPADAQITPAMVRFGPEMDPLVERLESCTREQSADVAASLLRSGVTYRQLLSAVFLAGIRNVNPRPPGFALHCVFLAHAANSLAMEAPPDMRWMPLFYTIDDFKSSQQRDRNAKTGDYTMAAPPAAAKLPPPERAAAELAAAMDAFDADRAERAVIALVRQRSANDVFEILWRHAIRDYRNIGHKAIFAANACRTLHTIGWRHAEPVLRSLVLGLADFGPTLEMNGFVWENQSWHKNVPLARTGFARLPAGWLDDTAQPTQTRSALDALRNEPPATAGAALSKYNAASCWDALHLFAAELRMRSSGPNAIGGIHAVSTANAMHYAFAAANDPSLRYLILLQAAGWLTQFRTWMESRADSMRAFSIVGALAETDAAAPKTVEETLAAIPSNLDAAARGAFQLATQGRARRQAFHAASLRTTISKADEVHYLKYAASLLEDIPQVSEAWQPHMMAAAVFYAKGPSDKDPAWAERARTAIANI